MTGRLSRPDFSNVTTKNLDNPKTHIQINIRTSDHSRFDNDEEGAEKLSFEDVFFKNKGKSY